MNILEIGERKKLAEHICKMYRKGFSVEEIAEILEEDLAVVDEIVKEMGIKKE